MTSIRRPWSYIALVVAVHCGILLLPAWLPVFRGAAHTTAFLLAGFALALVGMFWPGLKPRHLLVILGALLLIEPPLWFAFTGFFEDAAGELIDDPENHGMQDVARSISIQAFVSLIMSMGLWMRGRYDRFTVRRGGSDREERETLFDLKQELLPEAELTYLRYAKLLERGISLIGERMMRMRCVVHAFQRDEVIFLYDLMMVPGEPDSRAELLDATLARPEFRLATEGRVYLVSRDSRDTLELLEARGFRRVGDQERELIQDIQRRLGQVLKDEFKEWRPFSEVRDYYYQSPAAARTYAEQSNG